MQQHKQICSLLVLLALVAASCITAALPVPKKAWSQQYVAAGSANGFSLQQKGFSAIQVTERMTMSNEKTSQLRKNKKKKTNKIHVGPQQGKLRAAPQGSTILVDPTDGSSTWTNSQAAMSKLIVGNTSSGPYGFTLQAETYPLMGTNMRSGKVAWVNPIIGSETANQQSAFFDAEKDLVYSLVTLMYNRLSFIWALDAVTGKAVYNMSVDKKCELPSNIIMVDSCGDAKTKCLLMVCNSQTAKGSQLMGFSPDLSKTVLTGAINKKSFGAASISYIPELGSIISVLSGSGMGGAVTSLNVSTGAINWCESDYFYNFFVSEGAPLSLEEPLLVFTTTNTMAIAINARTGAIKWSWAPCGKKFFNPTAEIVASVNLNVDSPVPPTHLYAGVSCTNDQDATVAKIYLANGAIVWSHNSTSHSTKIPLNFIYVTVTDRHFVIVGATISFTGSPLMFVLDKLSGNVIAQTSISQDLEYIWVSSFQNPAKNNQMVVAAYLSSDESTLFYDGFEL